MYVVRFCTCTRYKQKVVSRLFLFRLSILDIYFSLGQRGIFLYKYRTQSVSFTKVQSISSYGIASFTQFALAYCTQLVNRLKRMYREQKMYKLYLLGFQWVAISAFPEICEPIHSPSIHFFILHNVRHFCIMLASIYDFGRLLTELGLKKKKIRNFSLTYCTEN